MTTEPIQPSPKAPDSNCITVPLREGSPLTMQISLSALAWSRQLSSRVLTPAQLARESVVMAAAEDLGTA